MNVENESSNVSIVNTNHADTMLDQNMKRTTDANPTITEYPALTLDLLLQQPNFIAEQCRIKGFDIDIVSIIDLEKERRML